MSRAPALAPVSAPGPSNHVSAGANAARPNRRANRQKPGYVERALLLWPRLERSKLRRIADDPGRIAALVVRRTSQPYEVVLAMLTRQNPALAPVPDEPAGFEIRPARPDRVALRIVRTEHTEVRVRDLSSF